MFQNDLALVQLREGLKLHWYPDSLGKKTGGYGHLWRKGDPHIITQEVAQEWLRKDIESARKAATKEFNQLPLQTQSLYDVLVSCNYQFGNDFSRDFPKTFALMVKGDYNTAAKEAENSKWFKQTPVRVRDLQKALYEAAILGRSYKDLGL